MKAEVLNEIRFINTTVMRLVISLLCSVFLFTAYFLNVEFLIQALIFTFSVINMRGIIRDGFEALCNVNPNVNSLAAMSTFFAFLHGLIVLDGGDNYFCLHAMTLALFAVGEYMSEKMFFHHLKAHTFTDHISAVMLPFVLVLLVLTVILSLALGEGMYETVRRAFSAVALFCPVSIGVISPIVSVIYAKIAASNGIFINSINAVENLGRVREIICDEQGIITEEEYKLYDIYAANGDKAQLLSSVAAIEANFENFFAFAVVDAARKICTERYTAENCFEICGRGVGGIVNGEKYLIGNKKLFKEKKIVLPSAILNTDFFKKTPLYVAKNGEFCGALIFYNRKKNDAVQAIDAIRGLGKRCVLLAANEHTASKGNFDILLSEREKVLQEFKKSVKIKAMVISKKPIANADVVASIYPSDNADVVLSGMKGGLFSLVIGKSAFGILRKCTFVTVAIAVALSVSSASGAFVSSVFSVILTALPLLFVFGAIRFKLPEITTSEEDEMFGKINYTIRIDGMSCAHCSARVKNALEEIKGVSAKISLEEKIARVKCSAKTTADELAKAVSDVGFTVVSTERV